MTFSAFFRPFMLAAAVIAGLSTVACDDDDNVTAPRVPTGTPTASATATATATSTATPTATP
jgi:hypothetical protein